MRWDQHSIPPLCWDQTQPVLKWDQSAPTKGVRRTMDKVKVSPSGMLDKDFVGLINNHKTKMTDNPNFPTPSPTAQEFDTSTNPYLTAAALVTSLEDKNKIAIDDRIAKRPDAEQAILDRRDYVQKASGGVASIILSSGFAVAAKPGPPVPPHQPASFAATMGDLGGHVDTMWDAQRGRTFIVQSCEDPMSDENWKQAGVTTNSRYTVTGLTSGKKYWFRVCALLGDQQGPWSDPALCMAP